jgi:hypothetical protein
MVKAMYVPPGGNLIGVPRLSWPGVAAGEVSVSVQGSIRGLQESLRSSQWRDVRWLAYLRCLSEGDHDFIKSKSHAGHVTCFRCRYRQALSGD